MHTSWTRQNVDGKNQVIVISSMTAIEIPVSNYSCDFVYSTEN